MMQSMPSQSAINSTILKHHEQMAKTQMPKSMMPTDKKKVK